MRTVTNLFIILILLSGGSAMAQRVTLTEKNTPLKQVFENISNQTGYDFLVSTENLKTAVPVTISVQNEELKSALDKIFSIQPLTFVIQEKTVVVSAKNPAARGKVQPSKTTAVSGKVTDDQGQPLPGATVRIPAGNITATCDKNGLFNIVVAPELGLLVVSFIGFTTMTIPYDPLHPVPEVTVLKNSKSALDEVQIIGYGETTKRLNTGNISSVKASVIEEQPVTNPLAVLQGRAPGVLVQTQNGLPGGNIKVQIRGQGSLASGTDPLFIIDGVPFLSTSLYGQGNANGANGIISPFSIINPGDIESMEILKDADATAIYGSRGANGVILITTKKGKAGQERISADVSQGISRVSRFSKFLSLSEYLKLRRQAFANDKITPTVTSAPDLLVWDTTKVTDWQKYFYGGTARTTNAQVSLSGGDANNQYLVSANYHDEGTILPGDENYKKGGGYFNFNHYSSDHKFTFSANVNYNKDDNHTLFSSFDNSLGSIAPNFPIYNANGSYYWDIGYNPVANLEQKQESKTTYLNINNILKYKFTNGLDAKISLGYNNYLFDQVVTLPVISQYPGNSPIPMAYFANNSSERYLLEPQFNYVKQIGKSSITALIGGTYQNVHNEGRYVEGDNVNNPILLGNIGAASSLVQQSNSYSDYRYLSVFSRFNYAWDKKYIIDLNFRRDGSSRFGPGNQFGNFWAVGGAWIFSDEGFFKGHLPWLSFGKFRASYGTTGNDQIGEYQYLSSYSSSTNYGGVVSLVPSRLANPDYSWETTNKLEAALELGFLKDRISLTTAYYRHTSSNQLISYKLPYIAGFASYQANFPATIENSGLEFELSIQPFKSNTLNWTTAINLTIPQNKLVDFPNIAASSYANTYTVGQDLSSYKAYQLTGIDPQTGLPVFQDLNGDGKISSPQDYIVTGKTSPKLFGGWSNSFSYKGLALDLLFEFLKRNYPAYKPFLGSQTQNDPAFIVDRWQKQGDITDIPRASTNSSLSQYYSTRVTDASYIRLKNISLSYLLKSNYAKTLGLTSIKIYVNGENIFTLSNSDRFDPEINSTSIPPLRTIVAGIKLNF